MLWCNPYFLYLTKVAILMVNLFCPRWLFVITIGFFAFVFLSVVCLKGKYVIYVLMSYNQKVGLSHGWQKWITLFSGEWDVHKQFSYWWSWFSFYFVGHDWSEVPSQVAFSWPCAVMLRRASIFSNDRQAYFYSWAWCYRSPRDWWMAGNSLHILSR